MKIATCLRRKLGFTLLELIVVIAILGTLMGIAYPTIMGVQENARIASSAKVCADVVAGVSGFKQDHNGILPYYPKKVKPDKNDQIYLSTLPGKDAGMLGILTGYEDASTKLNINNEPYMKPSRAESARDGLFSGETGKLGLYDPWGKPYYVVICETEEGCIDPFTDVRIGRENCLVYGLGPDSDGIAPAHVDKPRTSRGKTGKSKSKAGKKEKKEKQEKKKKMSKAEAKKAQQAAKAAFEEAILDNIYSWKKAVKK